MGWVDGPGHLTRIQWMRSEDMIVNECLRLHLPLALLDSRQLVQLPRW